MLGSTLVLAVAFQARAMGPRVYPWAVKWKGINLLEDMGKSEMIHEISMKTINETYINIKQKHIKNMATTSMETIRYV